MKSLIVEIVLIFPNSSRDIYINLMQLRSFRSCPDGDVKGCMTVLFWREGYLKGVKLGLKITKYHLKSGESQLFISY
jgi:hypothetical protein